MLHAKARVRRQLRMSRRHRLAIYGVVGALWLSGCFWLYLDQFVAHRGEFGVTPHPWGPPILLIHGIAAVLSMYLFGWISARHILRWWSGGLRRVSGVALAAFLLLLILSGFALFFLSDDAWQHRTVLIHDGLGLGVTLFAIQHWFFRGRSEKKTNHVRSAQ